jgi:hypothetical protein
LQIWIFKASYCGKVLKINVNWLDSLKQVQFAGFVVNDLTFAVPNFCDPQFVSLKARICDPRNDMNPWIQYTNPLVHDSLIPITNHATRNQSLQLC